MSQSRWRNVRDSTVPVLLGTLIVAMFYTTTSIHDRMAGMENRLGERITGLGDRIHGMEKQLSDRIGRMEKELSERITRLETVLEVQPEVPPGQAGAGRGQ